MMEFGECTICLFTLFFSTLFLPNIVFVCFLTRTHAFVCISSTVSNLGFANIDLLGSSFVFGINFSSSAYWRDKYESLQ